MEEKRTWKTAALDEIKYYQEQYINMKHLDAMIPAKKICDSFEKIYDAVYKIREKGDGIQGCAACKHFYTKSPEPNVTLFGCDKGVKPLTCDFKYECRFCENKIADIREQENKKVIERISNPKKTKRDVLDLCNFKISYYLKKIYPSRALAEEFLALKDMIEDLPDYPHPYDATLAILDAMPISIINHDEVDELLDAIDTIKKYMQKDWVKEKLKGGEA